MADDLGGTAQRFFDMMKQAKVSPTPLQEQDPDESIWSKAAKYLQGDPQAQAVITREVITKPSATPAPQTDPFQNFANKATGKPYR